MTPLGTGLRSGSCKPPKVDERSLFTSIQVSLAVLEGDLQIYEPWKKKRTYPKHCYATLYANETSPFLVWYKVVRNRNASTSNGEPSPVPSAPKPRCVVPVSRATLVKTTGGTFELTDFTSKLTFRFVAQTIREAELWVEKLAEESLREVNLDMRSLCSSRSSYSSIASGLISPDNIENSASQLSPFFSESKTKMDRNTNSLSDRRQIFNFFEDDVHEISTNEKDLDYMAETDDKDDVFVSQNLSCSQTESPPHYSFTLSSSPRQHVRAQPHLKLNVVLDKRRPDLRNVLECMPTTSKTTQPTQSKLPFSEFFVHVPSS